MFKRPERAASEFQASLLEELRNSPAPETTDKEEDAEEADLAPRRFDTGEPVHVITVLDDGVEACADVVDAASDRVWHIAVWTAPPEDADLPKVRVSHCFVIGSKNEARERLAAMTDGPAFVPHAQSQGDTRGAQAAGYAGNVSRRGTRVQQKQG